MTETSFEDMKHRIIHLIDFIMITWSYELEQSPTLYGKKTPTNSHYVSRKKQEKGKYDFYSTTETIKISMFWKLPMSILVQMTR